MVTKARQKKLRSLITEAVRHLSKDVLENDFMEELTVEGLLGITLDNQDVLLVNINETFYRETEEDDDAIPRHMQQQRRSLRSTPMQQQGTPNTSPRPSQAPRMTPQSQQRAMAMKRKLETTSPSQPAKRQTPIAQPTRATRSTAAVVQREPEPETESKDMQLEIGVAQETEYEMQNDGIVQQEPIIEHISATDATATTQEITSFDDLVRSAQGSDAAAQVYLPINIAKSSNVKVVNEEGLEGQIGQTEYADNVYVPISIERSTEVNVKVEVDPLIEAVAEVSDTDNLGQELELHVASDKDSNTEHLEKRVDELTGKATWICTVCEKTYNNKPKAQIHARRHFTPQCVCYWCGQQFLLAVELKQHAQVIHEEIVHVCEDCNKCFKLKKTYKHHMQDHEGNYAKICPVCQKGCKTNHYYKLHMQSHQAKMGKTESHICPTCGKQFGLKSSMRNHLRHTPCGKAVVQSHSELREKFDCPICGSSIYGLNKLNQHLELKHKTTVVYKCQYCGTDFNKKVVLASHENWCKKQQAMKPTEEQPE